MKKGSISLKTAAAAGCAASLLLLVPVIQSGLAKRAAGLSADPPDVSSAAVDYSGVLGKANTGSSGERIAVLPDLPDAAYLVRLAGNTLSVYREGDREPSAQYDLPAGWLPDYDRILLEYGVRAENAGELRGLLEDYVT